jgi:chemotaxis protein MotC
MTRRTLAALTLAVLALAAPPPASAEPVAAYPASSLSTMADELQRLQAAIAAGDPAAYPNEVAKLKAMTEAIAAAGPEVWAEQRQAEALVVYILSGGALAPVVPLIRDDALVASDRSLARGALAYVSNHEADAASLLGPVDVESLDVRLAGPVAFARSVLEARRNPKAALADLDWARLIAPGGLVEEAALRREIGLLVEAHEARRMALLMRQYAMRFPASLYAPDFFHDIARKIARAGLADDPGDYRLLSEAAAPLRPEGRRDLLLTLARAAALDAHFDAAAAAAGEALQTAAPASTEDARARLYLGAVRIFSDAHDAALAELQAIDPTRLDRSDAALLTAARGVAAELRATPHVDAPPPGYDETAKDGDPSTIARAVEALNRTVRLVANGSGAP